MTRQRLFLVRHGPTHEKSLTGWRDVPADLSDRAALVSLDAYLPQDAALVSSDLIRATATAEVLARGRMHLSPLPSLREIDFGAWDGMHWSVVAERDPELSRAFWEDPGTHASPQGESWNAASQRAAATIDTLLAAHSERDLIVVCHMGIILTQLARLLDIPAAKALSYRIDPLSVTDLARHGSVWQVGTINHLP